MTLTLEKLAVLEDPATWTVYTLGGSSHSEGVKALSRHFAVQVLSPEDHWPVEQVVSSALAYAVLTSSTLNLFLHNRLLRVSPRDNCTELLDELRRNY